MLERRNHELFFFSGGGAYQLLKKEFKNVYCCTPVSWYEDSHGIHTYASFLNILVPLPLRHYETGRIQIKSSNTMETVHRYYDLRQQIRKIKPNVIVSDGDIHALRLAHKWHIPSVYIANIIRPNREFSPLLLPGERLTERYVRKCSKIIVPDSPPPFTVCEYNLGDLKDIGVKDKVDFVGGFLDMTSAEGLEEYIFAPISGPYGTRAKLKHTIIPVLEKLDAKSIVSLGEHGKRVHMKTGNCEIYSWLSPLERREFMKNCSMIIFSGGHITCLETIKYAKPSICVPTQSEQLGNAQKMQDMGCSLIAKDREQLELAIKKIDKERQFHQKRVKIVNNYASRFNGLKNAVSVIETLALKA